MADEGRVHRDPRPRDIFALVKEYMADTELSQRPLKVLPELCLDSAERGLETLSRAPGLSRVGSNLPQEAACAMHLMHVWYHVSAGGHRRGLQGDRREQVATLRGVLQDYPQYARAVAYYDRVLQGAAGTPPVLQVLQAATGPRVRLAGVRRPLVREPVPGMQARQLRVVYHRRCGT